MATAALSGWGRYPRAECRLSAPATTRELQEALAHAEPTIPRGAGRAYGDSALNPGGVVSTRRLDRMISLSDDGVATCEAGVRLADLIDAALPRGWFPPVVPGTQQVTIGGMIAADVHGKNHHLAGSFCDHLLSLRLALGDGRVVTCSREAEPELFAATCGGMGLTGVITEACFKLIPVETAAIRQRTIPVDGLDAAVAALEAAQSATYAVAWIDCLARGPSLGRSLIFLGEHARRDELPMQRRAEPLARRKRGERPVPLDFPHFALSRASVLMFNEVYFRSHKAGEALVEIDPYFFPLDALAHWNRVYGRRGFVQHQAVLPLAESAVGLRRMLEAVVEAGQASFLAVLKRMGAQSFGLLSFPMPGYTLAMDFPVTPPNLALLDRLDAIVTEYGGRIYLAKDARARAATIAAGYPELPRFREVRRRHGLDQRFQSLQSRRLEL